MCIAILPSCSMVTPLALVFEWRSGPQVSTTVSMRKMICQGLIEARLIIMNLSRAYTILESSRDPCYNVFLFIMAYVWACGCRLGCLCTIYGRSQIAGRLGSRITCMLEPTLPFKQHPGCRNQQLAVSALPSCD